jgi:hypothetical protein
MTNNARLVVGMGVGDGVTVDSLMASSSVGWPCCGLSVVEGVSVGGTGLGADGVQAVVKLARIKTAIVTAVENHLKFFIMTS